MELQVFDKVVVLSAIDHLISNLCRWQGSLFLTNEDGWHEQARRRLLALRGEFEGETTRAITDWSDAISTDDRTFIEFVSEVTHIPELQQLGLRDSTDDDLVEVLQEDNGKTLGRLDRFIEGFTNIHQIHADNGGDDDEWASLLDQSVEIPGRIVGDLLVIRSRIGVEPREGGVVNGHHQGATQTNASGHKLTWPDNLAWNEITIAFITDFDVKVTARDDTKELSFNALGFGDRRKNGIDPTSRWAFLRMLAEERGHLDWETRVEPRFRDQAKAHVRDISNTLKQLFGISNSPFHSFKKRKAYETKFTLHDKR